MFDLPFPLPTAQGRQVRQLRTMSECKIWGMHEEIPGQGGNFGTFKIWNFRDAARPEGQPSRPHNFNAPDQSSTPRIPIPGVLLQAVSYAQFTRTFTSLPQQKDLMQTTSENFIIHYKILWLFPPSQFHGNQGSSGHCFVSSLEFHGKVLFLGIIRPSSSTALFIG